MKRIAKFLMSFVTVGLLLFSFSGCSMFDFLSVENLLKPPKLTGEKAELQLAFENAVGADVRLFSPVSGDYRGSYIIFDANNDGTDEAVVFYSSRANSSVVHMHLLSQSSGAWYSVGDLTGSGTEVYKVDFYNVDNTDNLEIGVIWSLDDSKKEKTLSLYRINSLDRNSENSLASLATIQIADYVYCDVDDDSSDELLYFYYESEKGASSVNARLIEYDISTENFMPISEVRLPAMFSSIYSIVSDNENDNLRFYVDCSSSQGSVYSEIIVYDKENGALFIPQYEDKYISELSLRETDIFCEDFNGDGYLDIPVSLDSSDSYVLTDAEETDISLTFSEWYTYLDGSFVSIGKYFINHFDGYALKTDDIYEQYYIVYDYTNKVTQVRFRESDTDGKVVFSIFSVNESDDLMNIFPDGLLGDKNNTEYRILISADGENHSFTETYIRSLIVEL